MRRNESQARLRREEAMLQRAEVEQLAQLRADRMERDREIDDRAQEILRQREALLDPQVASAYVTDDAIPRLEGDAPRMRSSSVVDVPLVASGTENVTTLYVSKLGSARIVRLSSDPHDHGRVLDEQLDRIYNSFPLAELLAAGEWEPLPAETA